VISVYLNCSSSKERWWVKSPPTLIESRGYNCGIVVLKYQKKNKEQIKTKTANKCIVHAGFRDF
jgi:hypothetical protein